MSQGEEIRGNAGVSDVFLQYVNVKNILYPKYYMLSVLKIEEREREKYFNPRTLYKNIRFSLNIS